MRLSTRRLAPSAPADLVGVSAVADSTVDPFVSFEVKEAVSNEVHHSGRTRALMDTQNPVWNEEFVLVQKDFELYHNTMVMPPTIAHA